ncbi:septal ring lytic transglycosylase RlpA family protein [Candidatus Peregrinibacteria bacterium]|nr:septal ring lytic transglycosylase RlpA family protein [Candidatus Peregrinibacteria bacterium]
MKTLSKFKLVLTISTLALVTLFSIQTASAVLFTDVDSNHPYLPAIRFLKQNGIVQGYSDGSFQPSREVNRAEALKILTLSQKILTEGAASEDAEVLFMEESSANTDVNFDLVDVPTEAWYYKYVFQAFKNNIISGYSDRTFRGGNTVNLAEAVKMLLETNNVELPDPDTIVKDPFKDAYKNEWYAPYLQWAKNNYVLIANMDLRVHPEQDITRQEIANLIYRFYSLEEDQIYGRASYYADFFDGRTTASGEIFRQDEFTAAHLTLPFGTMLKVANLENNKSVVVRITDRGPYDKRFVVDLSKTAFETISPLSRGVIQVYYEIIYIP